MPDPLLLAHEVAPFFFELGGRLSPVSIRDQMVRAQLLVDRAVIAKLISPSRPLLVIGAGAAGVTATIQAVEVHKVPTILIDRGRIPFAVQLGCQTAG